MSMEKFFEKYNSASIIFDPIPSYSGYWFFKLDNLLKNAKKENGVNLFQEFYNKTYAFPLKEIFKTDAILDLQVGMISCPNENNIGRCLKYSKIDFFIELTSFLNHHLDQYGKTEEEQQKYLQTLISNMAKSNEELNQAYSEALKEKLKKLYDLKVKEFESIYFDEAIKDYNPYKREISFSEYIEAIYNTTKSFSEGLLNLGDFFERKINYQEMANCFNSDTFYLLFAKIIYEFNLVKEQEDGYLDNSYCYLFYYSSAIEEVIKEDSKYNHKILFTLPNMQKVRYSRRLFQQEFKELMNRHSEAKAIMLPNLDNDNFDKYKDIEFVEKINMLYSESTKVNWEFLPQGEGVKKGSTRISKNDSISNKKDQDILISETNMRIGILENSGYIGNVVKGLNSFAGYYAFIYPNGKVILEKFWENENRPAIGCATYVMTIDNFIEMSKKKKIDLISYMRELPELGVKRIFHTSINNWQRNLYNEINGSYRLEDAIDFINNLKMGGISNE